MATPVSTACLEAPVDKKQHEMFNHTTVEPRIVQEKSYPKTLLLDYRLSTLFTGGGEGNGKQSTLLADISQYREGFYGLQQRVRPTVATYSSYNKIIVCIAKITGKNSTRCMSTKTKGVHKEYMRKLEAHL